MKLSKGLYESPTIQNLEAQASVETETTAALESRNDSMESELKTSTTVLLRFDGLSAILFVEKETEEVSAGKGQRGSGGEVFILRYLSPQPVLQFASSVIEGQRGNGGEIFLFHYLLPQSVWQFTSSVITVVIGKSSSSIICCLSQCISLLPPLFVASVSVAVYFLHYLLPQSV